MDLKRVPWRLLVLQFAGRSWPVAWAFDHVHTKLVWELVAIGDTENPVVPLPLGVAVRVLSFPMLFVWDPAGDWLEPYLTDNGVLELFIAINALFWAFLTRRFLAFTRYRTDHYTVLGVTPAHSSQTWSHDEETGCMRFDTIASIRGGHWLSERQHDARSRQPT